MTGKSDHDALEGGTPPPGECMGTLACLFFLACPLDGDEFMILLSERAVSSFERDESQIYHSRAPFVKDDLIRLFLF
jgi:hypothetical protein